MTDRELLELAAKAAGLKIDKSECNGGGRGNTGFDLLGNAVLDWYNNKTWNPLTNDGDALRLAVKLQMSLALGPCRVQACTIAGALRGAFFQEDIIHQDHATATRRAIVLAAAEIGKSL